MRRPRLAVDVPALLKELGVDAYPSGNEMRGWCPDPRHQSIVGSSAALRSGPGTWQVRAEGDKAGFHHCYSCGFGGGPVSLVAAVRGLSYKQARSWLARWAGHKLLPAGAEPSWDRKVPAVPALRYPRGTRALWRDVPQELRGAVGYLEGRGLSRAEIERWRIGAVPEHEREYAGRVIVPVVVDGIMVDFVARLFVDAPRHIAKALSGRKDRGAMKQYSLWGYDELDPDLDVVHVVEGVWAAVAVLHAGVPNVVAACGSAWSDERTNLLSPWRRVVLIPDADEAGEKMIRRASGLRFGHDLRVARLPAGKQPDDVPDRIAGIVASASPPNYWASTAAVPRAFTSKH